MFRISHFAKIAAGVLIATSLAPNEASAGCQPDPYIGQICWTAANFCPRNYAGAEGQIIPITNSPELFSLIGTAYGGDGRTNFRLPDLRGRSLVGLGSANPGEYPVTRGQMRGTDVLTINAQNLPMHSHDIPGSNVSMTGTLKANKTSGGETSPAGNFPGVGSSTSPNYSTNGANANMSGNVTGTMTMPNNAVSSTSGHSYDFLHRPPSLGLTACIAMKGTYPPRP
ncbi:tail fiber protein [Terasakiella sp. SH-1]|uniref:phage tail protein n=1 Tax=Terasakiella sp. SH-1 TaxID=2560057 RepID=UPI0014317ECF|nr:tail fiber protein [Terasakiella sp. SH-1]